MNKSNGFNNTTSENASSEFKNQRFFTTLNQEHKLKSNEMIKHDNIKLQTDQKIVMSRSHNNSMHKKGEQLKLPIIQNQSLQNQITKPTNTFETFGRLHPIIAQTQQIVNNKISIQSNSSKTYSKLQKKQFSSSIINSNSQSQLESRPSSSSSIINTTSSSIKQYKTEFGVKQNYQIKNKQMESSIFQQNQDSLLIFQNINQYKNEDQIKLNVDQQQHNNSIFVPDLIQRNNSQFYLNQSKNLYINKEQLQSNNNETSIKDFLNKSKHNEIRMNTQEDILLSIKHDNKQQKKQEKQIQINENEQEINQIESNKNNIKNNNTKVYYEINDQEFQVNENFSMKLSLNSQENVGNNIYIKNNIVNQQQIVNEKKKKDIIFNQDELKFESDYMDKILKQRPSSCRSLQYKDIKCKLDNKQVAAELLQDASKNQKLVMMRPLTAKDRQIRNIFSQQQEKLCQIPEDKLSELEIELELAKQQQEQFENELELLQIEQRQLRDHKEKIMKQNDEFFNIIEDYEQIQQKNGELKYNYQSYVNEMNSNKSLTQQFIKEIFKLNYKLEELQKENKELKYENNLLTQNKSQIIDQTNNIHEQNQNKHTQSQSIIKQSITVFNYKIKIDPQLLRKQSYDIQNETEDFFGLGEDDEQQQNQFNNNMITQKDNYKTYQEQQNQFVDKKVIMKQQILNSYSDQNDELSETDQYNEECLDLDIGFENDNIN